MSQNTKLINYNNSQTLKILASEINKLKSQIGELKSNNNNKDTDEKLTNIENYINEILKEMDIHMNIISDFYNSTTQIINNNTTNIETKLDNITELINNSGTNNNDGLKVIQNIASNNNVFNLLCYDVNKNLSIPRNNVLISNYGNYKDYFNYGKEYLVVISEYGLNLFYEEERTNNGVQVIALDWKSKYISNKSILGDYNNYFTHNNYIIVLYSKAIVVYKIDYENKGIIAKYNTITVNSSQNPAFLYYMISNDDLIIKYYCIGNTETNVYQTTEFVFSKFSSLTLS